MKLFTLSAGDLVYNRLFAWKSSFGLVQSDLNGAAVSGGFPSFEVDAGQILPEYLLAVTGTDAFMSEVNARSAGSTPTSRNRLKERQFLSIEVGLPPIEVQERTAVVLRQIADARKLIDHDSPSPQPDCRRRSIALL